MTSQSLTLAMPPSAVAVAGEEVSPVTSLCCSFETLKPNYLDIMHSGGRVILAHGMGSNFCFSITEPPLRLRILIAATPSCSCSLADKPQSRGISRRLVLVSNAIIISTLSPISFPAHSISSSPSTNKYNNGVAEFSELPDSGGVKALDLRIGSGSTPLHGDQVAIHYYGRLGAKQGWRFDSTYDHKDSTGEPMPFTFILGSGNIISGIEAGVRSMKVGGVRRLIIPPSEGYQNTSQQPLPPDFFDRQRLFTTIFNPTRLANGEGSTLGTLIFDIELVSVKH